MTTDRLNWLLAMLVAMVLVARSSGEEAPAKADIAVIVIDMAIEHRLNEPITVEFREQPLRQIVSELRDLTGLHIVVDEPALEEEAIDLEQPVSLEPLEGVGLKSALNILLRKTPLTFVVRDGAVQITTRRKARNWLVRKIYQVPDLLVPISGYYEPDPAKVNPEMQRIMDVVSPAAEPAMPAKPLDERLIQLIVKTIAPATWTEAGGRGSIEYFPLGMVLVVTQTADVHDQIADLLEVLRRLHELQLTVELRMIRVRAGMAERLQEEFGIDCSVCNQADEAVAAPRVLHLDDVGVFKLMEALQGDGKINITQAPKLTLYNGQVRTIQLEDFQRFVTDVQVVRNGGSIVFVPSNEPVPLDWSITVQGIVLADRRSVQVNLELTSVTVPLVPVTRFITDCHGQPVPFTQYTETPQFHEWRVTRKNR